MISNATILAMVALHYPNASLLPDEAKAENSSLLVWEAVCGSIAFATAYANETNRTITASFYVGDLNRTVDGELYGSLFASFSLVGVIPCPVGVGEYPSGYPCQESDRWSANLSTDIFTGHQWSVASDQFVPCQTPVQNQTNVAAVAKFYPNPAQQPSESTEQFEVNTIWGEVCTSLAYFDAYWAHTLNESMSEATTTSNLYVKWEVYWGTASCPVAPPAGARSDECVVHESWTADLVADNYSGPTLGYSYALNGSGPSTGDGTDNGAQGNGLPFGLTTNEGLALSAGGILALAMALVLLRGRRLKK